MTQANDIAGLFKKLGTSPDLYQELVRQNEVQKSRERWPLLSAIQANEPAPPPVEIRRQAIRQAPPQAAAPPQQVAYAPAATEYYGANPEAYQPSMQYPPAAPQQPYPPFARSTLPHRCPRGLPRNRLRHPLSHTCNPEPRTRLAILILSSRCLLLPIRSWPSSHMRLTRTRISPHWLNPTRLSPTRLSPTCRRHSLTFRPPLWR